MHRNRREPATDRKDNENTLDSDRPGLSTIKLEKIRRNKKSYASVGDDLTALNNLLSNKSSTENDLNSNCDTLEQEFRNNVPTMNFGDTIDDEDNEIPKFKTFTGFKRNFNTRFSNRLNVK